MITFKNDKPFTEGIIDDSLNSAMKIAGIPKGEIKDAWDQIQDQYDNETEDEEGRVVTPTAYNSVVQKANVAADLGGKGVKSKLDSIMYNDNKIRTRSIVARARNSVLQFPVYVTQSLPVNYAQVIAKLFERVYTTLVQTTLSQNVFVSEKDANELVFLKQFHTNLNESTMLTLLNEYYEPIDDIDSMLKESVYNEEEIAPGVIMRTSVVPCVNQTLISENARLINDPLTGLAYLKEDKQSQVSKDVDKSKQDPDYEYNQKPVSDSELRNLAMQRITLSADERAVVFVGPNADDEAWEKFADDHDMTVDEAKSLRAGVMKKIDDKVEDIKKRIRAGELEAYITDSKGNIFHATAKKPNAKDPIGDRMQAPHILRDSDIKKINGLLPYTIEASFIIKETNRAVHFIIGIKTVMHLISSKDLSEDLHGLVTGDIKSLRKVRYKTGEIKFMDYIFNVKQIKKDAAKHINYNKRWINTLKRLSEYDKLNGSLLKSGAEAVAGGHIPIPNGTLVLSQTDVISMTNSTGIDVSSVSNAKRLAKSLFLIAVCIVDSSAGSMRVLFPDSDSDWDVQSLQSIEAELTKTDNSALMQELNKKINR